MFLNFRQFESNVVPAKLNALLLMAAVELDEEIDRYGGGTPSIGSEYTYSFGDGIGVWLLKVHRSPQGYLSYDDLRTMIAGLQLYLVLGNRPRSVHFSVLYGPNKVVLGHGAVGNLWLLKPSVATKHQKWYPS